MSDQPETGQPAGSFGYCAVCYHPLDRCSHCDTKQPQTDLDALVQRLGGIAAKHRQSAQVAIDCGMPGSAPTFAAEAEFYEACVSALQSERAAREAEHAARVRAEQIVRNTLWMAGRYADGRMSYAVGLYNDMLALAKAGGYDGDAEFAIDGMDPAHKHLAARLQEAEAKFAAAEQRAAQMEARTCATCRWARHLHDPIDGPPVCAHESEAHPLHWCNEIRAEPTRFGCSMWGAKATEPRP